MSATTAAQASSPATAGVSPAVVIEQSSSGTYHPSYSRQDRNAGRRAAAAGDMTIKTDFGHSLSLEQALSAAAAESIIDEYRSFEGEDHISVTAAPDADSFAGKPAHAVADDTHHHHSKTPEISTSSSSSSSMPSSHQADANATASVTIEVFSPVIAVDAQAGFNHDDDNSNLSVPSSSLSSSLSSSHYSSQSSSQSSSTAAVEPSSSSTSLAMDGRLSFSDDSVDSSCSIHSSISFVDGSVDLNVLGPVVMPSHDQKNFDLKEYFDIDQVVANPSADTDWQDVLNKATEEHEAGNFVESLVWYSNAAKQGSPTALLTIGLALRHGWGVPVDAKLGFKLISKAASAPSGPALYDLAISYRFGWGTRRDIKKTFESFLKGAQLGDVDCMVEVADLYMSGKGVQRSKYDAAFWFRKAESLGKDLPSQQWIHKEKYDKMPESKPKSNLLDVPRKYGAVAAKMVNRIFKGSHSEEAPDADHSGK